MRICVVGCGAVGSLFAANLATLDDVEVWVFDLNETHAQFAHAPFALVAALAAAAQALFVSVERPGITLEELGRQARQVPATSAHVDDALCVFRERREHSEQGVELISLARTDAAQRCSRQARLWRREARQTRDTLYRQAQLQELGGGMCQLGQAAGRPQALARLQL